MIIWIASYPKSGNTWIRSLLSSYLFSADGKFDHNLIHKIHEFPERHILKKYMHSKNFHNLKEVSKHWINVQNHINIFDLYKYNSDNVKFLKSHNALCNINGNNFTSEKNTIAAIYIVRDPRNVILSMSNHFGCSQEKSFDIITNKNYIIAPELDNGKVPATFVGSWDFHYNSWKINNKINKVIIKYEDMLKNTFNCFQMIIDFLSKISKIKKNKEKLINAVSSSEFSKLKEHEEKYGFAMGQKDKFFYLGGKNKWENLLEDKIEKKIREKFNKEMKELEYI